MYQLFCHNSKGPQANSELKQLNDKEIESHKNNTKYQKTFNFQQSINKVSPHGEVSIKGEMEIYLPLVSSKNKIKCYDSLRQRLDFILTKSLG